MDKTITPEVKPSVTRKKVKVKIKDTGHPASPTEFDFCRKVAEGAELSQTIISRRNPPCPWCITRGVASSNLSSASFPGSTTVTKQSAASAALTHTPMLSPATRSEARPTTWAPRRPVKYTLFTGSSLPHRAAPYLGPVDLELSETGKKQQLLRWTEN